MFAAVFVVLAVVQALVAVVLVVVLVEDGKNYSLFGCLAQMEMWRNLTNASDLLSMVVFVGLAVVLALVQHFTLRFFLLVSVGVAL